MLRRCYAWVVGRIVRGRKQHCRAELEQVKLLFWGGGGRGGW